MNFPKITLRVLILALFGILAAATIGPSLSTATWVGGGGGSGPQRLRVGIENKRLRPGETTKVVVQFLDRNYGQVVNDATRVIVLGQASSASKSGSSGSGYFDRQKIVVKPGQWQGVASFTSGGTGRLFITANSEGLEAGQALVLITPAAKASLLKKFVSLFETTAHAQNDDAAFEILPKEERATAGGRHRATFTLSFLRSPAPGTTVKIATTIPDGGGIFYKGQLVGGRVANIELGEDDDIAEISVFSARDGDFDITATVRPGGPEDRATVRFAPPNPTQIIFDADPATIGSEATSMPLTVRLADEGGFPIPADRERTINFSCATEGDQVSFDPRSIVLAANQTSAQVIFRLEQLPLGNELKLLATNDSGLHAGRKSIIIKSAIEKLMIAGPDEVHCGGNEAEYTVSLAGSNGNHFAADWNRTIDLHINGGTLSTRKLVIPKGQRNATFTYTSPSGAGKYVLTASSGGIENYTQTIAVTHKSYWLAMFALLGGLVGGVARQLYKYRNFGRILPRWNGKYWDLGFVRRLVCSLIGSLFFYWTFKLGLSQALGSPALPVTIDLGTQTAAIFLGGIGGYGGTYVLERLARWFLPKGNKRQPAPAQ